MQHKIGPTMHLKKEKGVRRRREGGGRLQKCGGERKGMGCRKMREGSWVIWLDFGKGMGVGIPFVV